MPPPKLKSISQWIKWYVKRKKLNYVPTSRTQEEQNKNLSYHIHIVDLGRADGLIENERIMLKKLLKSGCYISSCVFNNKGHVVYLSLGIYNEISDDIVFPYLQELGLSIRHSTSINFLYKHSLTLRFIRLRGNLSTIPDLSNVKNLSRLDFSHNQISKVNRFGEFEHLQDIDLSNNYITSLKDVEELCNSPDLQWINLRENQLVDLCKFKPLSHLKRLQYIDLSYNTIKDIRITHCVPDLRNLDLSHNNIENITAIENLTELEVLDLSSNKIITISFENFNNLTKLKTLDLSNNQLRSLPMKNYENLLNLEKIFIDENPIKSISRLDLFPNLSNIMYISLEHFSKSERRQFKADLREVGFDYSDGIIFRPPPPQAEFVINNYIILRLEDGETNIYVNGEFLDHCKFLLLTIPVNEIQYLDEIESIDEIAEKLGKSAKKNKTVMPSETIFWAHASNLQVWTENNYNTNLLHYNLAFPLLKKLTEVGDSLAKRVFKEEIAKRYVSGFPAVVEFLRVQGYLSYLSKEELESLI